MRDMAPLALCFARSRPFLAANDVPERANGEANAVFWLAPKTDLDLNNPSPVAVQRLAAPDGATRFALLWTGDVDPSESFVPSRPELVPDVADEDTRNRIEPQGLKVGVRTLGDLTLLQTNSLDEDRNAMDFTYFATAK